MDTRREEVKRRAEIIILTRHDIPQLAATMMSQWHNGQCSHNLGRAQWSKFYFACTFRIGLDCVAGCVSAKYRRTAELCTILLSCIILLNIAQLRVFAQYCTVVVVCNDTQWTILLNFSQSQLSLQRYAAWDNAKSSPILI